jgi:hypothetical protein
LPLTGARTWVSAKWATTLAAATTTTTKKITTIEITVGSLEGCLAIDRALRSGDGGPMGGMSTGAGAHGTKDGPLGDGPMPVLSEPLGSSISDHGSAGLPCCRDRVVAPVVHRQRADKIVIHRIAGCRRIRLLIRNLTT